MPILQIWNCGCRVCTKISTDNTAASCKMKGPERKNESFKRHKFGSESPGSDADGDRCLFFVLKNFCSQVARFSSLIKHPEKKTYPLTRDRCSGSFVRVPLWLECGVLRPAQRGRVCGGGGGGGTDPVSKRVQMIRVGDSSRNWALNLCHMLHTCKMCRKTVTVCVYVCECV